MASALTTFKSIYSVLLLIWSLVLIHGFIFTSQTKLSSDVHPALAFVCLWGAVGWLTMVEGGQASLVGLAPVNAELYKDSHKYAYKCAKIVHKGDGLDRYLMGRQFMVVIVVFTVNMSGGPNEGAELWGIPQIILDIFLGFGLAMILFTCMVGQLNSQVNASHHMLDYLDNWFGLFTLYFANFVEFSGLLHASYLVAIIVGLLAGQPIESNEGPRTGFRLFFFWFRILFSLACLGMCTAVTFVALFDGKTTIWEGVPASVALVIFFILMCIVGMLEAMQIAFFAVAKMTEEERGSGIFAKKTCKLLYFGEGNNLPGFMVGRQLCVVSCMFFVARVTSVKIPEGEENIFGVGEAAQGLFSTGLLGALFLTIMGSISWQLVASAFPIAFMQNPLTYYFLVVALGLEATGICQGAWVLAAIHKKIAGFQRDEVYIGTAEERKKQAMGDNNAQLQTGAGHMVKLPGFADNAPPALRRLLKKDPSVGAYINSIVDDLESTHSKE